MRRVLLFVAVAGVAFVAFSWNLWSVGTASGWVDPVLRLGSQDEATYTNQAIRIATQGDWMTPTLAGRWAFEKPPLLVWLSALSMKLWGIHPYSARLPAVLAGTLIAVVCFAAARTARSTTAGVAAVLLCLSNQLLFTLARRNMTDILLAAATLAALAVQTYDPPLARRRSRVVFTLAVAAGILTKSIAGLLPIAAALLFAMLATHERSARLRRTLLATLPAVGLAAPWFLYHLIWHRQWLLADTAFQILTVGGATYQTSPEHHVAFYALRLLYAAPATLLLIGTGLPGIITALRRRDELALLLLCYVAVLSSALLLFRFHSQPYLAPLMPVLILLAVHFSPWLQKPYAMPVTALLAMLFAVKAANPDRAWGISQRPGTTLSAAKALTNHCEQRRGNHLYILGINEELYALVLPLAHVHYGWLDPEGMVAKTRPHYVYLGIVQDATTPESPSVYASRLQAWRFPTLEPLATAITAKTVKELAAFVLAHPEGDFLLSPPIAQLVPQRTTRETVASTADYVLLQSPVSLPAHTPRWTCRM